MPCRGSYFACKPCFDNRPQTPHNESAEVEKPFYKCSQHRVLCSPGAPRCSQSVSHTVIAAPLPQLMSQIQFLVASQCVWATDPVRLGDDEHCPTNPHSEGDINKRPYHFYAYRDLPRSYAWLRLHRVQSA